MEKPSLCTLMTSSSLWEAALKHQEDVCIRQIRVSVQALRNTAQHAGENKLGQMLYGGNPNTVLVINTMVLKVAFCERLINLSIISNGEMFQVSFGGLIPGQTFQQDSNISSVAKLAIKLFENQETFSTLFKSVEEEPRLVGRTVKLTCSLVCTIYETRLNLIEDKSRGAQLFVGISLKR